MYSFMVSTATRSLFCHVFINQNVKVEIFFLQTVLFYRLKKTGDKIDVAGNRMITDICAYQKSVENLFIDTMLPLFYEI